MTSDRMVFPPVAASDLAANIVPDMVRVPQSIRGADGVVREYAPGVIVRANRDGVTYTWTGASRDVALALFTPGALPTVAEIIRALGPCTAELTDRVTIGGGG